MRFTSCTALATLLLSSVTMTQAQTALPLPRWMQAEPAAAAPTMPNPQLFASAAQPAGQLATMPQGVIVPSPPVARQPIQLPAMPQPSTVVPVALPLVTPQPAAPQPAATVAPATGGNPFRTETPVALAAPAVRVDAFSLDDAARSGNAAGAPVADIDLRALRFYASERNLERVSAETRRLKAENPGWEPPADLFAPVTTAVDEQPLWDLFAAGNFGELRRRIAIQQQQSPDWRPSDEMSNKLVDGEVRARVMAAAHYGRWSEVVERAAASRGMLVCANMDMLWTVAQALAKTGKMAESFELYRYAITNCGNEQERLATVQKASIELPVEGKDALIQLATSITSSPETYERLRFDELRNQIGAIASGQENTVVDADELARFATFIQADRSASDAGLLGWYFYAQQEHEAAAAWFQAGMQVQSDPKLVEGAVLSLRGGGKIEEARDLAYRYRATGHDIARLYIEIVAEQLTDPAESASDDTLKDFADTRVERSRVHEAVSQAELRRFAELVLDEQSALGAQALGWRFVNLNNLSSAEEWFTRSVGWEASEGGVIGTAVVAARLKQSEKLQAIKTRYQANYPELADFRTWSNWSGKKAGNSNRKTARVVRSSPKVAKAVKPSANDFWQRIEFK